MPRGSPRGPDVPDPARLTSSCEAHFRAAADFGGGSVGPAPRAVQIHPRGRAIAVGAHEILKLKCMSYGNSRGWRSRLPHARQLGRNRDACGMRTSDSRQFRAPTARAAGHRT
jgi:hypothetical protein